jgi:hypothetical protein
LVLLLVVYAIDVRHDDDICIAVNPRHVRFYERLFPSASQFGDLKRYNKVNGAPAVLLRLDLRTWPAIEEGDGDLGRAYDALVRRGELRATASRLASEGREAVLTSEQFAEFFKGHPALTNATAHDRAFVEGLYLETEPSSMLHRLAEFMSGFKFMPA